MNIEVQKAEASEVTPLRELHRQEMNCQIVSDSYLQRGFTDPFLLRLDGCLAGYGLVAHRYYPETVMEFYVLPGYRASALPLFRQLLEASGATKIKAQTNDRLMLLMLYDCGTNISSDTILFADSFTTHLPCPDGNLRKVAQGDREIIFEHKAEPVGDWMIEREGLPVATGGALFHYNPPYGDLYMEVHEEYRRRGYGSYLIQELKRVTYEGGHRPAARTGIENIASRKTMEKAGMLPCARILIGEVKA